MKWSWSPLSYEDRAAAIARFRELAASRAKPARQPRVPPEDTPDARRPRTPHAVMLGWDVLYVVHTLDIDLATELMTDHLLRLRVDTPDIKLILSDPVALNPWVVEPHRAHRLEGVLFRC